MASNRIRERLRSFKPDCAALEPRDLPSIGTPFTPGYFEYPPVGTGYQYQPYDGTWNYIGGSGVAGNNSAFTSGNSNAPQGSQVAFLQDTGYITQTFTIQTPGWYILAFQASDRSNFGGQQQVRGAMYGNFPTSAINVTPDFGIYTQYSTPMVYLQAGMNATVKLAGLNGNGDNTAFIDNVFVVKVR